MKLPRLGSILLSTACLLSAADAAALPGFFAPKHGKAISRSTHIVVMMKDDTSVVTVMPDYEGDIQPFALVLPVPSDVTLETVHALKRDFVDRVDQISAPRFHEFWELDACEPGKAEQEWERDLTAKASTNFLGAPMFGGDEAPAFKVEKEMNLDVEAKFKESEHTFSLLTADTGARDIVGWLKGKGYTAPERAGAAVQRYVDAGMNLLVTEINHNKVELEGADRMILSPIRYQTRQPVTIHSTLGLVNLQDKQELYIYVIHPDRRFETANYPVSFPPTNLQVDFKVKERMGEYYAGLHDLMLAKKPTAFLAEYAWPTQGCGQPCPNEALLIHELLSLGGDVFEEAVPEEIRKPKAPEMTEEEKKKFDEIKEKDKKQEIERVRTETARRKALLSRHKYLLSRLHHRYDAASLPKDVELRPTSHVKGGIGLPKGAEGALPLDVTASSEPSALQTRFVYLHPSIAVIKCDNPERWRWGKPPRTYMGLRKIWIAQDMATRDRKSISPLVLTRTPVPALGIRGGKTPETAGDAGADAGSGAAEDGKGGKCGCGVPGEHLPAGSSSTAAALLLAATLWRRARGG